MAVQDNFKGDLPQNESYERQWAVTPNDSNDLPLVTRAISCAVAGNISVLPFGGVPGINGGAPLAVSIYLANGFPQQLRVTRILATGTTATGIVAYD